MTLEELSLFSRARIISATAQKKFLGKKNQNKTTTKPKTSKAKQKALELPRCKVAWLGNSGAVSAHKINFKK